jgi:hypothetical protein
MSQDDRIIRLVAQLRASIALVETARRSSSAPLPVPAAESAMELINEDFAAVLTKLRAAAEAMEEA